MYNWLQGVEDYRCIIDYKVIYDYRVAKILTTAGVWE